MPVQILHRLVPLTAGIVCLLAIAGCTEPVRRQGPSATTGTVPATARGGARAGTSEPFTITGNVIAATGPKAVSSMTLDPDDATKLRVSWGWSTSQGDYGSDTVPANYIVGLFIWNANAQKWSAFKVDSALTTPATWADRIQRFHDLYPSGGIDQRAPGSFASGSWCVRLAAASTPQTGGVFIAAPGAAESCVTVPSRRSRH